MATEACTQSLWNTWHTFGLHANCIQVSGWLHSALLLVSLGEGIEAWEEGPAAMACTLYLNKAGLIFFFFFNRKEKQLPRVPGNTQAKLDHQADSIHSPPLLPHGTTALKSQVLGSGPAFKTSLAWVLDPKGPLAQNTGHLSTSQKKPGRNFLFLDPAPSTRFSDLCGYNPAGP